MGAAASNAKQKAKRSMQETWDIIRNIPLEDGKAVEAEDIKSIAALKGANLTVEQAMIMAIARKAMKGDVRAFEALCKYTESNRKKDQIASQIAELELEKLKMEVEAYHRASEQIDVGVTIVDDIPNC